MHLPSLLILSISLLVYAQAFTINTPSSPTSKTCSQSCLFPTPIISSPTFSKLNQKLRMTSVSNSSNDEDEEASAEALSTEKVENKSDPVSREIAATNSEADGSRSMLFNALIYGPPLIAKFCVVILVKIITDLVVFPVLFLCRFCNLMKNKVVQLFNPGEELLNGEKINGTS